MTNIKYLKEHDLYDAHQHFKRLAESYIPSYPEEELDEAGEEDAQDPNAMGGDPNAMGGDMGGADPNMGGGDPNAMGADPNGMDGGADMGGDPNAMGGDPNAMGGDMGGTDPNMGGGDPNAMGADPNMDDPSAMGDNQPTDDEVTIDIDGLTKAQDKLNVKQNHIGRDLSTMDNRMDKLINVIQTLQAKLDSNNSEIEALKSEFEKRNPTQTEKLNLRSLDSYPYSVQPISFWKQQAAKGGYDVYGDNNEPTTKEFVITNDDVDNPSDDIANTFFKVDDDDIQTLDKLFNL